MPTFEQLGMLSSKRRQGEQQSQPEIMRSQTKPSSGKVRKGGKKGGPKKGHKEHSCSSEHGKKDLSHVKCFKCHKMGHYASQCPRRRRRQRTSNRSSLQGSVEASRSG
jgi:hypothetical protein